MITASKDGRILVIGGTGHYGQHIVRALLKKNYPVRVLSRNKKKALKLLGENSLLDVLEGDILDQFAVRKSLDGISAIVIAISAFNRKTIRKLRSIEHDAILDLFHVASEVNIDRIVYISVYEKPLPTVQMESGIIKYKVEEALEQSTFDYTILGAPPSIEIFFSLIRGSKMRVPGGGPSALPNISPIDLGEIAAQAALRSKLPQKRYRLAGPSAPSFPEAAIRISNVTGKEISFGKIPLFPVRATAKVTGWLRFLMPYIAQLLPFILLLNSFESEIALQVTRDYEILQQTFDYNPHTLEDHAKLWIGHKEKME
ncbi:MAG: SDR family oxidoreductase [Candidatus Hodarchaeales archaeon]